MNESDNRQSRDSDAAIVTNLIVVSDASRLGDSRTAGMRIEIQT
jgi:hypothetical protein